MCDESINVDGVFFLFFFQAEDGIRDLVRSRGLGDVYKRQPTGSSRPRSRSTPLPAKPARWHRPPGPSPVSYTHLTLPTSDLV